MGACVHGACLARTCAWPCGCHAGVPDAPITLSAGAVFFIGHAFAGWLKSKGHDQPHVSVSRLHACLWHEGHLLKPEPGRALGAHDVCCITLCGAAHAPSAHRHWHPSTWTGAGGMMLRAHPARHRRVRMAGPKRRPNVLCARLKVGHDPRLSGDLLEAALTAGLLAGGAAGVYRLGLCTTPACFYSILHSRAQGGHGTPSTMPPGEEAAHHASGGGAGGSAGSAEGLYPSGGFTASVMLTASHLPFNRQVAERERARPSVA